MSQYTEPPVTDRRGYTVIPVLEFLRGSSLDDVAWGFIHALRPSCVRIVTDGVKLDAVNWRVTIWMNGTVIRTISQEVEVALHGKIENGGDLSRRLWWER